MKTNHIKMAALAVACLLSTACSKESIDSTINDTDLVYKVSTELESAVFTDLDYGDHEQQIFDVYLPANRSTQTTKVIILLHGGGWMNGDKAGMNNYVQSISESNPDYAIVNMNYVLAAAPSTPAFPNQFHDIGLMLDHLTSESESLQILPEFALIGKSAGAHLALQYDYMYDLEDRVKSVTSIVGPTDFTHPYYSENPNYTHLLNILVDSNAYFASSIGAMNLKPNVIKILSPLYQASVNSSPTLLFYGKNDTTVPVKNAYDLEEKLNFLGVPVLLNVFEGGHNDWNTETNEHVSNTLTGFLKEHFTI
ncbi:hypothetical protein ULVI_08415 [Cochleicola gelatinilyticus]|uniref:BD-FAE-like domain-containing protein n=2 Tax=Cochleicola gelatinilyticus TaxID=1763537 RepID=A0A167HHA2_9FLAO|nr:hypothetical protein ULVI_08415 [Cochleicola gelatinilyticus]